jgi:hypothetical protein
MSFSHAKRLGQTFKGKPAKKKIDLSKPIVSMTPAEQEFADSVIREHFAEDRTEIVKQLRVKRIA